MMNDKDHRPFLDMNAEDIVLTLTIAGLVFVKSVCSSKRETLRLGTVI